MILDTTYRHKVSLASNNEFTGVFQAIVSVLHSLHHLHSTAITILLYVTTLRVHVPVVASLSMSNRPDTCDSLHVTNLASDVVSIAAILHLRS